MSIFLHLTFNFLDANLVDLFVALLLGSLISFVDSSNNGKFGGVPGQFWHEFLVFLPIYLQPHPGFYTVFGAFLIGCLMVADYDDDDDGEECFPFDCLEYGQS